MPRLNLSETAISPADRPTIAALAGAARVRLEELRGGVVQASWLEEAPLSWSVQLLAQHCRQRGPEGVQPALALIAERVAPHGPGWQADYGRLLTLGSLAALPERRPRLVVPEAVWPDVEHGVETILDETSVGAPSDWTDEFFMKDLAVAHLELIPYEGLVSSVVWCKPSTLARVASLRERLSLAAYLRGDYRRRAPYLTAHQWRGFRVAHRRPWTASMAPGAELARANPAIRGMFFSGWPHDPALRHISPEVLAHSDGYVSAGARRFRMVTSELARLRAVDSSRTRRAHFESGTYTPTEYGFILSRRDIDRWLSAKSGAGVV